jgi:cell division protein FtsI (penicillin-binding protein 3)
VSMRGASKAPMFEQFRGRLRFVLLVFMAVALLLAARAIYLQLFNDDFLQDQARFTRVRKVLAHRGSIYDRNMEPLAVTTPVDSVWVCPPEIQGSIDQIPVLARALHRPPREIAKLIARASDRKFVYLARHMQPEDAYNVKALGIPGVYLLREYRRFYTSGEVAAHLLGFTRQYEDKGQEGLELAFDPTLSARPGAKRVIQDSRGHTIEDLESIVAARPGEDLITSIDLRIQYLAYRELKAAVQEHHAKSGSMVIIDIDTGEVLAMVNQPFYNPNVREQFSPGRFRNRAATDVFEPGSSIKPFVAAAALATGRYHASTVIDTSPGYFVVGGKTIRDKHNLGAVTLTRVIAQSSNVGMARMSLTLSPETIWKTLEAFGFGETTESGFPGEGLGKVPDNEKGKLRLAVSSYGYGLSVTPLQLARAYAILGAGGIRRPVSLQRLDTPVEGRRVISEAVAREMRTMMEEVVSQYGTGNRAALAGYRVAGKTGTAWKAANGGYSTDKYVAVFGGVVPASRPKLAAVVVINEPSGNEYYGGDVAAPVFAKVLSGALRLMAVAPDGLAPISQTALEVQSR